MNFLSVKNKKAFTLIELLVVVAIIAVLASVVLVSLNSARKRARDAVRKKDMQTIYTMLLQYSLTYGGIPQTSTYSVPETFTSGGWDYSSEPTGSPEFLSFLVTGGITNKVPVDPINNMTGDQTPTGTYAYKYYCYAGTGLALGYTSETTGAIIYYPSFQEPGWTCL